MIQAICPKCKGTGRIECPVCSNHVEPLPSCPCCEGKREITCPACLGGGIIDTNAMA